MWNQQSISSFKANGHIANFPDFTIGANSHFKTKSYTTLIWFVGWRWRSAVVWEEQTLLLSSIVNVSMGPLLRALMSFRRLVGVKMCEDPRSKAKRAKHQEWHKSFLAGSKRSSTSEARWGDRAHWLLDLTDDDLAGLYGLVDLISRAHLGEADPSKNKDDEAGARPAFILGRFAFLPSAVEDRTRQSI